MKEQIPPLILPYTALLDNYLQKYLNSPDDFSVDLMRNDISQKIGIGLKLKEFWIEVCKTKYRPLGIMTIKKESPLPKEYKTRLNKEKIKQIRSKKMHKNKLHWFSCCPRGKAGCHEQAENIADVTCLACKKTIKEKGLIDYKSIKGHKIEVIGVEKGENNIVFSCPVCGEERSCGHWGNVAGCIHDGLEYRVVKAK